MLARQHTALCPSRGLSPRLWQEWQRGCPGLLAWRGPAPGRGEGPERMRVTGEHEAPLHNRGDCLTHQSAETVTGRRERKGEKLKPVFGHGHTRVGNLTLSYIYLGRSHWSPWTCRSHLVHPPTSRQSCASSPTQQTGFRFVSDSPTE